VPVNSLEEMAETTMSFLLVKPPKGKRVAVIGSGGGTSVAAADVCSNDGLEVPPLSQDTQNELKKFIPLAGNSIKNPLDTTLVFRDVSILRREVEAVAADPAIDMLIIMPHIDMALRIGASQADKMITYLCDFAKNNPFGKPAVIVFHSFANDPTEIELRSKRRVELTNKGIAVYSTLAGASRALAKLHDHSRIHNDGEEI
jgi:acyl-CoA synthetase (NDP forming)